MNLVTTMPLTPALVRASGVVAEERFTEFFTVPVRNPNTRRAYVRAVEAFCAVVEPWGVQRSQRHLRPVHVAAHIEALGHRCAPATVKQRLAAIRACLDWMVVGQVIPMNPVGSVRGPRHVVRRGSTPVLPPGDARRLLENVRTDTVTGLRDRALIALMIYSFARVGVAVGMQVQDFHLRDRRWWLLLHEKGGMGDRKPLAFHGRDPADRALLLRPSPASPPGSRPGSFRGYAARPRLSA